MRTIIGPTLAAAVLAIAIAATARGAFAESTADEIAKYREALQDGNPA